MWRIQVIFHHLHSCHKGRSGSSLEPVAELTGPAATRAGWEVTQKPLVSEPGTLGACERGGLCPALDNACALLTRTRVNW